MIWQGSAELCFVLYTKPQYGTHASTVPQTQTQANTHNSGQHDYLEEFPAADNAQYFWSNWQGVNEMENSGQDWEQTIVCALLVRGEVKQLVYFVQSH